MKTARFAVLAVVLLFLLAAESRAAGLLVPRDGSRPIAVKSHRVEAVVSDGMARTKVRQTFVNPYSRPLEAVYVFPLPEGAALTAVAMETGGQRLEGLLAERKRARRIYDDIVRRKKDPALVEQIGRDMFRLSVFPVIPGEDTVVEIEYVEHLPLAGGEFRYVYPLAAEGKAAVTKQDLTVSVRLQSSLPLAEVSSSVEAMQVVRKSAEVALASFEEVGASLDTDIVVTAKVVVEKPTLTLSTWRGPAGEGVFLAIVTPPAVRDDQLIPRDVILVIDSSGSMRGKKIEQARASALYLLDHLRAVDRVNVVRFSSDVQPFADEPVPATPENLERLRAFVTAIEAKGGTAIADALKNALRVEKAEGRVRTVVFLTDGRPTVGVKEPAELVKIAKRALDTGLRIFPFGVGEDVDGGLLRGIAHAARGRAELFRPGGEVESRLTSFLLRTSAPVLSDLEFAVDGLAIHDVFPRPLPDVYLGEQVAIVGRYPGGGERDVTVSANVGGKRASLSIVGDFRAEAGGDPAVSDLFAKRKLDWLEEQLRLRLGLSDDAYYEALDRGAYGTEGEIVEEIVATSLAHGVQCAYTSFLVLLPEDRARLDPRDVDAIAEALERVRKARGEVAMTGDEAGEEEESVAKAGSGPAAPMGPSGGRDGGGRSGRGVSAGESGGGGAEPSAPPSGSGGSTGGAGLGAPSPGGKRAIRVGWRDWWAWNGREFLDRGIGGKIDPVDLALLRVRIVELGAEKDLSYGTRRAGAWAWELGVAGPPAAHRHARLTTLTDAGRPDGDRALAALALGHDPAGAADSVPVLVSVVTAPATPPETRAACALALSLLGDRSAVPALTDLLGSHRIGDRPMTDLEEAWIVHALGRIGDPAAVPQVLRTALENRIESRRAAIAALGPLAVNAESRMQRTVAGRLLSAAKESKLVRERDLAAISLGRLVAATADESFREYGVRNLLDLYSRSGRGARRSFAGLALGLLGTGATPLEEKLKNRVADALLADLRMRTGDREELGALAVAIGLLGDDRPGTAKVLVALLEDRGEVRPLRGAAAIGLGLLRAEAGRAAVLAVLRDRGAWEARTGAATAAGLYGGDDMVAALVEVLGRNALDPETREAAARSLGRAGSPAARAALFTAMGEDDSVRPAVMGALAGCLGCGPSPSLTRDLPWPTLPPDLRELLAPN